MKIAITADPFLPVPPDNYGGIERIIEFLALGLQEEGHEVILLAHKDSTISVPLLKYPSDGTGILNHVQNTALLYTLKRFKPDIIHSFSRLAYLLPLLPFRVPKIMSYQREPTPAQIKLALKLAKKSSLSFTGCSDYISNKITPYGTCHTVYNGVDMAKYHFQGRVEKDAPFVFLGRLEPIKGVDIAIQVAKRTKRKLVIAGNIMPEFEAFFREKILAELDENISYIGPVNDAQKNDFLGKASALLMPIVWDEPFGIVMAEAMACGTPVLGFNRGAVPEIIRNGINGYRCDTIEEMIISAGYVQTLDRTTIRADIKARFSNEVIVKNYMKLYNTVKLRSGNA